jgi:GxxExxY protein
MDTKPKIRRQDLLYPELSYEIVGALLEVYKTLGPGLPEKVYQRAVAEELKRRGIKFKEQVAVRLIYKDLPVGIYYADFVIEDKIVLELKTDRFFSRKNIDQTVGYLQALNLQLGILANFTRNGLEYKRLINLTKKNVSSS